jgi:hypothetical protein
MMHPFLTLNLDGFQPRAHTLGHGQPQDAEPPEMGPFTKKILEPKGVDHLGVS